MRRSPLAARRPIAEKMLWTIPLIAPAVGPLLYLALYSPPSVQDAVDRAPERPHPFH